MGPTVCIQVVMPDIDVRMTSQGIGSFAHVESILLSTEAVHLPRVTTHSKREGRGQGEWGTLSVNGGVPLPSVGEGRVALQGTGQSERLAYHGNAAVAR